MKKFCVVLLAVMFVGAAVVSAAPQPFTDVKPAMEKFTKIKDKNPNIKVVTPDQRAALRSAGAGSVAAYGDTFGAAMLLWGSQYGFYGFGPPQLITYDGATTVTGNDVFDTISMVAYDVELDNGDGTFTALIGFASQDYTTPFFPCFSYSGDNILHLELDIGTAYAPPDPWQPFGIFHWGPAYLLFFDSEGNYPYYYAWGGDDYSMGFSMAVADSYTCYYGIADIMYQIDIEEAPPIPALGVWGPIALAIPLLIGGAVLFRRRPA